MRVLLASTYELGHQPLHVASPAGALLHAGHEVRCLDLSVEPLDLDAVRWADVVALSVPMHTALRLARGVCHDIRAARPEVPVWLYGLYAGLDGAEGSTKVSDLALVGEYETELVAATARLEHAPVPLSAVTVGTRVSLGRSAFVVPARRLLPGLENYARLSMGGREVLAGYVEASHGCAHRCRHCPVPVVYDGRTRIVALDTVVADVDQLVAMGARHITYGDPDFLNGPHHAQRVIEAVHGAFPTLTFDVTAKVEHILAYPDLWPQMAAAGCVFVVSAFESASDGVLAKLDKGHDVAGSVQAVSTLRRAGIEPRPTFVPFTPWTQAPDIETLLDLVETCDLVGNVDPVQYAIRLLVPPGSLLLASGALEGQLDGYDPERLGWMWHSADERLDTLAVELAASAEQCASEGWSQEKSHDAIRRVVTNRLGPTSPTHQEQRASAHRSDMAPDDRPRLTESWFCCAEPTDLQLSTMRAPSPATVKG